MEGFPSTPNTNEEQDSILPAPPESITLDPNDVAEGRPLEVVDSADLPPAPPEFNPFYPSSEEN